MRRGCIAALLLSAAGARAELPATLPPEAWLGVSTQTAATMPALPEGETRTWPSALEVIVVAPDGPGEGAGLRVGDHLLALDGASFDPKDGDPATQLRRRVEQHAPGDVLRFTALRVPLENADDGEPLPEGSGLTLAPTTPWIEDVRVTLIAQPNYMPLSGVLGPPLDYGPDRGPVAAIIRTLVDRGGKGAAMANLRARLARLAWSRRSFERPTTALRPGPELAKVPRKDPPHEASSEERLPFTLENLISSRVDALESGKCLQASVPAVEHWLELDQVLQHGEEGGARVRAAFEQDDQDAIDELMRPGPWVRKVMTSTWMPRHAALDQYLDAVERLMGECAFLRARAFESLTAEEAAFLRDHVRDLPPALAAGVYLHDDADRARARSNRRVVKLAGRVDPCRWRDDDDRPHGADELIPCVDLARSGWDWMRLADPEWLAILRDDLRALPNASDPIVARRETPQGAIVVAGTGPNVWRDEAPAVIIDLGGDDIYANNAGSSFFDVRPVAAVLDLGGNDSYEGTDSFVQGCGVGGVGLLVDLEGDDRYLAHDAAQGVGIVGYGLLADIDGDDRYRALHFAQGVGAWGMGVLMDEAGDDTYEALSHAQGVGLPEGLGMLHDRDGDDRYFAKGGEKTGYGTQGVYDAWSQGCGLGLRWLAHGGDGLLIDRSGRDDYEAGSFAQGGGYYFGYGVLQDAGKEPDRYVGSRYNMGWAAHQALGAFLDRGGDDTYVTHHGVICGLAWDESLASFWDFGGDDTYRAGFFSLGASAHNGIATFVDGDGSDTYAGAKVARAGGNEYHGGSCVSLFLDLGRGDDDYVEGDGPAPFGVNGEHGFALDLPGRLDDWADEAKLNAWLDRAERRAPAGRPASARRRGLGR